MDRPPGRGGSGASRLGTGRPVLKRIYQDICPLKDLLVQITRDCGTHEALSQRLVQAADPEEYTDTLLCRTMAALSPSAPPLQRHITLSQNSNQQEVVLRCIDSCVRTNQDNVLRYGYRQVRGASLPASSPTPRP